jgi:hypothetical protein
MKLDEGTVLSSLESTQHYHRTLCLRYSDCSITAEVSARAKQTRISPCFLRRILTSVRRSPSVLSEKELSSASVQVTTPFARSSNTFTSSSFLSAPADSTIDGNLGEKGQGNSMQPSNFTYTLPWRNYIENKKRRWKYELTGNEVRFLRY